ncbi:MAG: hypothetical protein LUF30_06450, partial [Lachnospiraceae bacterium]|nr:hypothetical protein [Lachnospiraceae bacterium]
MMKRSEIRENIFKLVFCGDFYSMEEIPQQVTTYFEEAALPDAETGYTMFTDEEQHLIQKKFDLLKRRI